MARQLDDAVETVTREDFDAGPSSYDQIIPGLYLGNLTAATDIEWLREERITHILTVDSCPLPRKVQEQLPSLILKYLEITDMPREDLLTRFEDSYEFIEEALNSAGRVLVHCYFGVSRSASIVIAYLMKRSGKSFAETFETVKEKRRFVGPNAGFTAQLRLYEDMGCSIDNTNVQFKMYRLQIAADKVRKAKILPQNCTDLIKPDPALTTVRPEPTVYRCKKCRRILANASNILPHVPREKQIWRHISSKRSGKQIKHSQEQTGENRNDGHRGSDDPWRCPHDPSSPALQHQEQQERYQQQQKRQQQSSAEFCKKIYFVEPLAWMPDITHNLEGKLNCPKCSTKLGSFSWIAGSQCPCGSKIAPAFYFVPSKVDWSNAVQNVQVTV